MAAALAGSATEAGQRMLNRHRAGQASYSEVVTNQVTALNTRRR
ncbi:hypothetical protein [Pseudoduganella sp. HUAS MS19]